MKITLNQLSQTHIKVALDLKYDNDITKTDWLATSAYLASMENVCHIIKSSLRKKDIKT